MVADTVSSLPLHHLILTGQDTPEKMQLLFSPQYKSTLKEDHKKLVSNTYSTRLLVLHITYSTPL